MANDSLALGLAWVALFLSTQKQRMFAIINGLSLVGVAVMIVIEAAARIGTQSQLQALPMMMVAGIGLMINLIVAWMMLKSSHNNVNIKAAYLHVLADLFGSVVAIVAGLCAWALGWYWVDTIASVLLSVFVFKSGVQVAWQAYQAKDLPSH